MPKVITMMSINGINASHRDARTFTAVELRGGGAPYWLAPALPGNTSSSSGKMLFTSGTRFSRYSQPDQPRSCRRCTPICTLTQTIATNNAKPSSEPRMTPAVGEAVATAKLAVAIMPEATSIATVNTSVHARYRKRPMRPSMVNTLSVEYSGRSSPTGARGGA